MRELSYSDPSRQLLELKNNNPLPSVCRDLFAKEKAQNYSGAVSAQGHGDISQSRPQTTMLNSTVRAIKISATDDEGLLIGSTDNDTGRKRLATHFSSLQNFSIGGPFSYYTPFTAATGILRGVSNQIDKPGDRKIVQMPIHSLANECVNLGLMPIRAHEVLKKYYPDLVKGDEILLSKALEELESLKGRRSIEIELVMDRLTNPGYLTASPRFTFIKENGEKEGWQPESGHYLSLAYSNYSSASDVASNNADAIAKVNGLPYKYPVDAESLSSASHVILSQMVVHQLLKPHWEEIQKLIDQRDKDCEKRKQEAVEKRSTNELNQVEDFAKSVGAP